MKKYFITVLLIILFGLFLLYLLNFSEKNQENVVISNGIKHSVPLEDILSGGPEKDGIPSIDNPIFIQIEEANDYLEDDEVGISVSINGIDRFYPFQILVYHEIVNDKINGQRVLITYCPLCQSGLVFDPMVQGERVEFGVSGKLWNSNLVMYDRKTESYWSQALGKGIVGEMTDEVLEILPFDLLKYGAWKNKYPDGQVLSRDTGALKFYGYDPYEEYHINQKISFPVDNVDDRLEAKELILGIIINDEVKAYVPTAVQKAGQVEEIIGGEKIVVEYIAEIDSIRMYKKNDNDELERINPVFMYWFSWAAIHPDTDLYN